MITINKGDIFESECQYLVNPVNCEGIMGKGLALQFKAKYPSVFTMYQDLCDKKQVKIGQLVLIDNVILFPTKDKWHKPSKIEYIALGLPKLGELIKKVPSVAIPALGCGLGNLRWIDVKNLFELWADCTDLGNCKIKIYSPVTKFTS